MWLIYISTNNLTPPPRKLDEDTDTTLSNQKGHLSTIESSQLIMSFSHSSCEDADGCKRAYCSRELRLDSYGRDRIEVAVMV